MHGRSVIVVYLKQGEGWGEDGKNTKAASSPLRCDSGPTMTVGPKHDSYLPAAPSRHAKIGSPGAPQWSQRPDSRLSLNFQRGTPREMCRRQMKVQEQPRIPALLSFSYLRSPCSLSDGNVLRLYAALSTLSSELTIDSTFP